MTDPFETYQLHGFTVQVFQDDCAENPRSAFETRVRLVCWHSRYRLGDSHDFYEPADFLSWWAKAGADGLCVPLYLYDHSGLALSTRPFHCPWDSGQIGWAYLTAAALANKFPDVAAAQRLAAAQQLIDAEVELYNAYISGDVWGFTVRTDHGADVDRCWGYYGLHAVREAAEESVKQHTDPALLPKPVDHSASHGGIRHG